MGLINKKLNLPKDKLKKCIMVCSNCHKIIHNGGDSKSVRF